MKNCLFCLLTVFSTVLLAEPPTLNRGNGGEPDSLNIHQAQGLNSQNLLMDVYEGLMTFDAHGQVVSGVAISHQVSADQLSWQFKLNPQARWSDGQSLTSADFLYAWQQAIDPLTAAPYRQLFDNLITEGQLNVQAPSAHELHLTLNHPDSSLLNQMVLPVFYPLPAHQPSERVSNGAYVIHDWRIQQYIELKKNPHYHAAQSVYFERVKYWVTENQNSELLRFRAGELDITETIPDNQIDWIRQHLADELRLAPYYGTFFLGLNLDDTQLSDLRLRQALNLAIDRQILVDKVLKSGQLPAAGIIPRDPEHGQSLYDPQQAKSLLSQSSFRPQTDQLEITYNNSDNQKKVALAVAAMWRQHLGIRSRLKSQEWKVFVNTRRGPLKQVFRSGWIADYHDPMDFLRLFHSASPFNFYGFKDAQYDELLSQLTLTQHQAQRHSLIDQAEGILAEQLPVIPLYHYVSRHLVSTDISGFHNNPMDKHLSRYLQRRSAAPKR